MPSDSDSLEMKLRRLLKEKMARGHVELTLNLERGGNETFALNRQIASARQLSDADRAALLAAREAVWSAWFAGDAVALAKLVPTELITIDPGSDKFGTSLLS